MDQRRVHGESSLISHISWKYQLCLFICSSYDEVCGLCSCSCRCGVSFLSTASSSILWTRASWRLWRSMWSWRRDRPTDLPFTAEKGRFRRKRWRYPQSPPSPLVWWTRWWEEGRHRPLDLSARWWTWKCVEHYPDGCTQPATANHDEKRLCGISTERKCGPTECYECWPCCTCPDTPSAHEWNT